MNNITLDIFAQRLRKLREEHNLTTVNHNNLYYTHHYNYRTRVRRPQPSALFRYFRRVSVLSDVDFDEIWRKNLKNLLFEFEFGC